VAVIDRTEWHFGQTPINVLMVGVAHYGIAFPIVWTALGHGGGSGAGEHVHVLDQFLRVVEREQVQALVADREFTGGDFLRALKDREVPFVIRIKRDRRVGRSPESPLLPVRMFMRVLSEKQSRRLDGERVLGGAQSVPVQVAGGRLSDGSMLILAVRAVDSEALFALYRRRWEIETLFAALRSRGFDLEATHLTAPGRIRKLLGVLALAYSWTRLIGRDRRKREGPLRSWLPRPKSLSLWTGSVARDSAQPPAHARRTPPMSPSAYVSELIFVVWLAKINIGQIICTIFI